MMRWEGGTIEARTFQSYVEIAVFTHHGDRVEYEQVLFDKSRITSYIEDFEKIQKAAFNS